MKKLDVNIYLCIHVFEFANLGPKQILDNGNPRKSFTFDLENFDDTVDFAIDKLLSHTKSACKTVATCNKDKNDHWESHSEQVLLPVNNKNHGCSILNALADIGYSGYTTFICVVQRV